MKRYLFLVVLVLSLASPASSSPDPAHDLEYLSLRRKMVEEHGHEVPKEWGENVTGVRTRLATGDKVIALTFDACGSARGMAFDTKLVEFLEKEEVPATFFINDRWIEPNRDAFHRLAANPRFEIGNHGYRHKPASVSGRSVYGITGTKAVAELVDEIELSARRIEALTGRKPRFFRAGTAYYDEVAVRIAAELGEEIAGFSVLGDAGATFSRDQVRKALLSARAGDIVILHMNHPESGTAAGVMDAVPELKKQGYRFVRLSAYPLK